LSEKTEKEKDLPFSGAAAWQKGDPHSQKLRGKNRSERNLGVEEVILHGAHALGHLLREQAAESQKIKVQNAHRFFSFLEVTFV
jgi:hypothetical protein